MDLALYVEEGSMAQKIILVLSKIQEPEVKAKKFYIPNPDFYLGHP